MPTSVVITVIICATVVTLGAFITLNNMRARKDVSKIMNDFVDKID